MGSRDFWWDQKFFGSHYSRFILSPIFQFIVYVYVIYQSIKIENVSESPERLVFLICNAYYYHTLSLFDFDGGIFGTRVMGSLDPH